MNDAPSASASTAARRDDRDDDATVERPLPAEEIAERRKNFRNQFNRKRGVLLEDLLRQLDILVYAELSAIYHMDCSFFRFFIRGMAQLFVLTPKSAHFPKMSPNPPYMGAIFGTAIMCIFMHWYNNSPSAGEPTRGYLHGGLAMDFIGQKGPTSKVHLILLDSLVLVLQVVQMSIHLLRDRLKTRLASSADKPEVPSPAAAAATPSAQSLDDEERGVRRSAEQRRGEDIEMQNLNPGGQTAMSTSNADEEDESSERATLLAQPQHSDAHVFNAFSNGQIVIADLDVFKSIRDQLREIHDRAHDPAQVEQNRLLREREAARATEWRNGIVNAIRRARQRARGAAANVPEP